jgi:predicted nucleotidyltransferase
VALGPRRLGHGKEETVPLDIIVENRGEVEEACKRHSVKSLELFGSGAGLGFDPNRSDLDFLVTFAPCSPEEHYERYFGLLEALEECLGRRVDLVEEEAVSNPYLLKRINESRVRLYAA